jgi:hypothetical protein
VTAFRRLARSQLPPLLAAIHDPPPQLYLRGAAEPELLARPAVAVVGARSCSGYGSQVARLLGRELARAGAVVVSGMARGIDGEAHRGALEGGGPTVAVLGCGIDRDYPAAHAELARRIAEEGLIVSEYEPGVEPAPWRFPARECGPPSTKPIRLNHAGRPCRIGREMRSPCGPGVVLGTGIGCCRPGQSRRSRQGGDQMRARVRRSGSAPGRLPSLPMPSAPGAPTRRRATVLSRPEMPGHEYGTDLPVEAACSGRNDLVNVHTRKGGR